jgi:hypothetical protein
MYCDRCGTPFNSGAQYCSSCGKQLMTAAVPPAQVGPAVRTPGDGRVRRNINILAGFWLVNGILRLMEVGWILVFHRLFFSLGDWAGSGWPLENWFGLGSLVSTGLLLGGVFLGFFGLIHLLLAWSLFERQPWARIVGIVIGFLALLRFPFGTALGIYTLWVLLPEGSGREYAAMAATGGRVNAAGYSA